VEYAMARVEDVIKMALRRDGSLRDGIAIAHEGERQGHYHQQTACMLVRVLRPMVLRIEITYLQKETDNAQHAEEP